MAPTKQTLWQKFKFWFGKNVALRVSYHTAQLEDWGRHLCMNHGSLYQIVELTEWVNDKAALLGPPRSLKVLPQHQIDEVSEMTKDPARLMAFVKRAQKAGLPIDMRVLTVSGPGATSSSGRDELDAFLDFMKDSKKDEQLPN